MTQPTTPDAEQRRARIVAGYRKFADLIEANALQFDRYGGASVGAIAGSREELEAWANALGAEIIMGGTDGDIPAIRATFEGLRVGVQSPAEPKPAPAPAPWRDCGHRADYASEAEHERDCPVHGADSPAATSPAAGDTTEGGAA